VTFHDAISDAGVLDSLDVRYPIEKRTLAKLDRLDAKSLQASERSCSVAMPAVAQLIEIEK
jgi:hypothetical protein